MFEPESLKRLWTGPELSLRWPGSDPIHHVIGIFGLRVALAFSVFVAFIAML